MQPQDIWTHSQDLIQAPQLFKRVTEIEPKRRYSEIRLMTPRRIAEVLSNYSFHDCGSVHNTKAKGNL